MTKSSVDAFRGAVGISEAVLRPGLFSAALVLAAVLFPRPSLAADSTMSECLSASETSIKLRRDHRLSEARQQLLLCTSLSCPGEVRSECERRLVEINGAQPTIIFEPKDAQGNDLVGVSVTENGKVLVDQLRGTALTLDPGAHPIRFEAAGYAPVEKTFMLHESEKARREVVVMTEARALGAHNPSEKRAGAKAPSGSPSTEAGEPARGTSGALRTVGWVLGGIGVIGLGVGAAFGVVALTDKGSAHCANNLCDPGTSSGIKSAALVSDIGWVAGGVLLAGGVALVILAPKSEPRGTGTVALAPTVATNGAGLLLEGSF